MAKVENITVRLSISWWFKYAVYALAILSFGGPMNDRALDWIIKYSVRADRV